MPMIVTDSNGNDIEVFTPEELASKEAEIKKSLEETIEQERLAKEELERKMSEQAFNFKKLRDMTEEQKKSYSAKEIELLSQVETTQNELEEFKRKTEEREMARINSTTENFIKSITGGNDELSQKIRENMNMLNIQVTTEDDIYLKVEKAAAMAGIVKQNPLTAHYGGSAPSSIEKEQEGRISQDDFKKLISF